MTVGPGRLGWGILGASDIAARYMIPAIREQVDGEVVAVMGRSPERLAVYAAANSIPRQFASTEDMLADPSVDVVYVCSDNRLHPEHVLAAAQAGKPVLCEKPLALTVEAAAAMVEACRAAGVVMATNHHLRTAAPVQAMRRLVAEGAVGRGLAARVFHAVYLPEHLQTWRIRDPDAGGGAVNDIAIHDFDALRNVRGQEAVEVNAMIAEQGMTAKGIEDAVMGVLRFEDGLLVMFHAAYNIRFAGTGFEIHGSEGSLFGRNALAVKGGDLVLRRAGGEEVVDVGPQRSAYVATVRAFSDAVLGRGAPAATGADGLAALRIAAAAKEAARSGRAVTLGSVQTSSHSGFGG